MKILIQRVRHASVQVDQNIIGAIDQGLLTLVGVERHDTEAEVEKLVNKMLNYRIFADSEGKMNLNVQQINGGVLLVSQFTLAADTKKGLRPGFSSAATPEQGEALFNRFVERTQQLHQSVQTGQFGADMQITLLNDGPVTFMLEA